MRLRRYNVQKIVLRFLLVVLIILIYKLLPKALEHNELKHLSNKIQGTYSAPKNSTTKNVNACFLILVRNRELPGIMSSIRQLEDRFNNRHNYPYVMLNDKPFTDEFKEKVQTVTNSKIEFGLVPHEHWSYPAHVNQTLAKISREKNKKLYRYGGSESYRHMCRFFSGFFFRHELTKKYDYYWRVEPDVQFTCDIIQDPFRRMVDNDAMYGFTMALHESQETIPTLWSTTKEWMKTSPYGQQIPKENTMNFISSTFGYTYNMCHFWSNFEIGNFKLWRSKDYLDYFNFLDSKGGFFYERWGDAPVHSIYASLALSPSQFLYFEDIGYHHDGAGHCPRSSSMLKNCHCEPKEDYNSKPFSCIHHWKQVSK